MYDVAIIGCGITGASCAYMLSKFDLKVVVIEKNNDVANETTKANSAILHAGFDPQGGSEMAKLNVRGLELAKDICRKLDVPIDNCGSLVLAFNDEDEDHIRKLYDRGKENGVPGLRLLSAEETKVMEPSVSNDVKSALYAPSSCIVNPWEYCLAMAETAVRNGVNLFLNTEVTGISRSNKSFWIECSDDTRVQAKYVISASGVECGAVRSFLEKPDYEIIPTRGQYFLLDKDEGKRVKHTIFQCPNEKGKGVLVSPTVDGNLIVGPDAVPGTCFDKSTDKEGLGLIKTAALKSVPDINFRKNIRNFAGIRANEKSGDFIIEESKKYPGFFDAAGIKSPGLTAAPAIAEKILCMMADRELILSEKVDYIDERTRPRLPVAGHVGGGGRIFSKEEADKIRKTRIEEDPAFGRIVCRCETVTEGEIKAAIHTPIPPVSINGIKRRVGAGLGRCQGGFCMPKVQELLSQELKINPLDICLEDEGSEILKEII